MSQCICERSCGENRTDPDCPDCGPRLQKLRNSIPLTGEFTITKPTPTEFERACTFLSKAATQFRYYERNHREKMTDPKISREKLIETFDKAEANAFLAKEIEDYLYELQSRPKVET